jgi:hypothetical protein
MLAFYVITPVSLSIKAGKHHDHSQALDET